MEKIKNSRFVQNLKAQAEANPALVLAISAALMTATSKLMDAFTAYLSARTHAKEVERRIQKLNM